MTKPRSAARRGGRWVLAAALAASPAAAQELPRGEVAVYTGGSHTSAWFRTPEAAWRPGYAPAFGATGHLWLSPVVGVRFHAGYLPQNLPGAGGLDQRLRVVNGYLYDAGLAVRPLARVTANTLLQTVYLFAGAGGYTADVGDFMGPADAGCVPHPSWSPAGVCVPTSPGHATSAAGSAGGGIRLAPVADRVEAFGELAVHAYASPAHAARGADGVDRLSWTPRAVIGLRAPLGRIAMGAPARPDAAIPAPSAGDPRIPPAGEPSGESTPRPVPIQLCRVHDGGLVTVTAAVHPATGDTTVSGAPLGTRFPAPASALGTEWYVDGEPLVLRGRRFVKFGLPRALAPGTLRRVGRFRGVDVFAEAAAANEAVYVPLGAGCDFQAYVAESKVGAVRG